MNVPVYTTLALNDIEDIITEISLISELAPLHLLADKTARHDNSTWGWYTHAPFLYKKCKELIQDKTKINILEIGMGHSSSSILSYFAANFSQIQIETIETIEEWHNTCTEKYYKHLKNVVTHYHTNFEEKYANNFLNKTYDLIFVDQGSWEDRNKSILYFYKQTKSLIVHDYDYNLRVWPDTHNILEQKFKNIIWDTNWHLNPLTNPPTIVYSLQ